MTNSLKCILSFVAIVSILIAAHPFWFGDAVWYAMDLREGIFKLDPGHLIWKPAASLIIDAGEAGQFQIDPLTALRTLSLFGAATASLAAVSLAKRLGLRTAEARMTGLALLLSHFTLAYGGSGSSYTGALGASTAAWLFLLPARPSQKEWSLREGAFAALFFTLAWACWGVQIVMLPVFFLTAFLTSRGRLPRRAARAAVLSAGVCAAILSLATAAYLIDAGSRYPSMREWLRSSSHGIPLEFGVSGILKASLGLLQTLVFLGSLGSSVRDYLTGAAFYYPYDLLFIIPGAILLTMLVTAAAGLHREATNKNSHQVRRLAALTLASLIPCALFAVVWQGSDVERFSPALFFLSASIVTGLNRRFRLAPAYLILLAFNLITLHLPITNPRGFAGEELAATAATLLGPKGILVLDSSYWGAHVWGPAAYFARIDIYNRAYDSLINGPGWESRLEQRIDAAMRNGGSVAVSSSFLESMESFAPLTKRLLSTPPVEQWNAGRQSFFTVHRENARARMID